MSSFKINQTDQMIKDGVTLAAYVCLDKQEITVLNIEILRRARIRITSTSPPLFFFLYSFAFSSSIHCNQKRLKEKLFFPQANHTLVELNKNPNNNSINKNKQTRACFLVLGRWLCVWDTAGLNSTVPSLCNWLRRLRSVTYSLTSLSFLVSLCSGSLKHTRLNHMLTNAAAPHHNDTF